MTLPGCVGYSLAITLCVMAVGAFPPAALGIAAAAFLVRRWWRRVDGREWCGVDQGAFAAMIVLGLPIVAVALILAIAIVRAAAN